MAVTLLNYQEAVSATVIGYIDESASARPKLGLTSLFPKQTVKTKALGLNIKRKRKSIAVDVLRCTDPNLNEFTRESVKIFIPPYFKEAFNFTQCQRYDVTFGAGIFPTEVDAGSMVNEAGEHIMDLRDKIERAIEVQRSQVLNDGIVTLINGDSIDYKRQAGSMKTLTGTAKWDVSTATPLVDFDTAGKFIRSEGQTNSNVLNAIFGDRALSRFLANATVKEQADFRRIDRLSIQNPVLDKATGFTYHGQFSTGDFVVNIWTYPDTYDKLDKATGTYTTMSYIDTDTVVILADDFEGKTGFAAVPALFDGGGANGGGKFIGSVESDFYVRDYIDQVKMAWWFEVSSAPLAVPVTIDRIYTLKTV